MKITIESIPEAFEMLNAVACYLLQGTLDRKHEISSCGCLHCTTRRHLIHAINTLGKDSKLNGG